MRKLACICCLLSFLTLSSVAQDKRLAVLGSSTAAGQEATSTANSWVGRLTTHYKNAGVLDSTFNLAVSGTDPYYAMPTGYVPPAGRANPNPEKNITKAIDTQANVIIVSFVSNKFRTAAGDMTDEEIKTTLHTIKNTANSAGIVCFVTTTQPRTEYNVPSRDRLRRIKDSILTWFGDFAINFWDPIVEASNNTIRPEYNSGDDIHLNDEGHRLLYEQVVAKSIFTAVLPVRLLDFRAASTSGGVLISWKATGEEEQTQYHIQRSDDGENYQTLATLNRTSFGSNVSTYSYTDAKAAPPKAYYRLKITEGSRILYSRIVLVQRQAFTSVKVYPVPANQHLDIDVVSNENKSVTARVLDANGRRMSTVVINLTKGQNQNRINLQKLAPGNYILLLVSENHVIYRSSFVKQ